jgi:uncharacterized membrane protein
MVTVQAVSPRSSSALLAALPAVVGVIVSFVSAVVQYAAIDGGQTKKLVGLDASLGLPNVGVSVVLFSLFIAWFVGAAAGARYTHGLSVAAIVVAGVGVVYQLVAVVLNFGAVAFVLLVAAVAVLLFTVVGCRAAKATAALPQVAMPDRRRIYGVVLVIAGLAGLTAAYNLSVDKVTVILSPTTSLNCNVSPIVACGKNLGSWQGSLLGFPNPLLGLGGFAVVLFTGIGVLAGVRFARWWWIAFTICVIAAFAFITFLIISSVYVIGTLCLWCALVWTVTIPTFWLTLLGSLKNGTFTVGPGATRFFAAAYTWVPLLTLACYLAILFIYQIRLDLFSSL